jgi:hypothetical protein
VTEPTDPEDVAPAGDAEQAMHIHKPKPFTSLSEFLAEILVIVVGIVIALGGEQIIETFHWRHKVDEAEQAMRIELARDDGAQAFGRAAISRCLDHQLSDIIDAVDAGRDRTEIAHLADAYQPAHRTWDRLAWEAAVGSDITTHLGAERLTQWGRVFDVMPLMNSLTEKEASDVDDLVGDTPGNGPLTGEEADQTIRAAKALRRINAEMTGASLLILNQSQPLGADPSPADQGRILAQARSHYGECVILPDAAASLRNTDQFTTSQQLAPK